MTTAATAYTSVSASRAMTRREPAPCCPLKPVLPFVEDDAHECATAHLFDLLAERTCCDCGVPHVSFCSQTNAAEAYGCWRNHTFYLCVALADNAETLRESPDLFAPVLDGLLEALLSECNHLAWQCATECLTNNTDWHRRAQTDKKRILDVFHDLRV